MRCKECLECEERMQPYLDRVLDSHEYEEAKLHLASCKECERRYHFEEKLRVVIHQSGQTPMPVELRERLAALRIAL
jgi:anti-sigma factor (TIGR02949 family)